MGVPQIVFISLSAISLGISMAQHGKPKTGNESFFFSLVGAIITYTLLIWGGFFK